MLKSEGIELVLDCSSIGAMLEDLLAANYEIGEELHQSLNTIRRVDLFTQVASIKGSPVTLEGVHLLLKKLEKVDAVKIDDIYNKALNDVRLLCLWGRVSCIPKIREAIKRNADSQHVAELKTLSKLSAEDRKIVKHLQKISYAKNTFLEKGNLSTWKLVQNAVKNYNEGVEENKLTLHSIGVDFPVLCKQCALCYGSFIRGSSKDEEPCMQQIERSDKHKAFFTKLKKAKEDYAKYTADKNEETLFKNSLAQFAALYDNDNKDYFSFVHYKDDPNSTWSKLYAKITANPGTIYFLLALVLLVILASVVFKRSDGKTKGESLGVGSNSEEEQASAEESGEKNAIPQSKVDDLNRQLEEKDTRIQQLNATINLLRKELATEKSKVKIPEPAYSGMAAAAAVEDITSGFNSSVSYYALRPDGDNGFLIQNLSKNVEDQLYYVITDRGDGTAEFELTEDAALQRSAAKSANTILNHACEYENLPRDTKTGIATIVKGQLKKSDNEKEWEIIKKAKIKFV
ncbi:MAG: hypothetical protein AAF985_11880 [Bacteroidota bacterium]